MHALPRVLPYLVATNLTDLASKRSKVTMRFAVCVLEIKGNLQIQIHLRVIDNLLSKPTGECLKFK